MGVSDDNVSANVRVFMALAGETHEDVAEAIGIARPSISARLNGRTAWSLDDVDQLASHYGVEPARFLSAPGGRLEQLRGPGGLLDPLGRRRRRPRTTTPRSRRPADDDGPARVALV